MDEEAKRAFQAFVILGGVLAVGWVVFIAWLVRL